LRNGGTYWNWNDRTLEEHPWLTFLLYNIEWLPTLGKYLSAKPDLQSTISLGHPRDGIASSYRLLIVRHFCGTFLNFFRKYICLPLFTKYSTDLFTVILQEWILCARCILQSLFKDKSFPQKKNTKNMNSYIGFGTKLILRLIIEQVNWMICTHLCSFFHISEDSCEDSVLVNFNCQLDWIRRLVK
jgi:hypothetical protein